MDKLTIINTIQMNIELLRLIEAGANDERIKIACGNSKFWSSKTIDEINKYTSPKTHLFD